MPKATAIYKSVTIRELKRTGNTATVVLEIDSGSRIDELMTAKTHGLIGLLVDNSTLVPVKLDRVTARENKLATIFVQHSKLKSCGVLVDDLADAELYLQYDLDAPLFPDEIDPFVKSISVSVSSEDDSESEDFGDDQSEAQRLSDEEQAAIDEVVNKPKKRKAKQADNSSVSA